MLKEDLKPPKGPGYLFTLDGCHYHYEENNDATQADTYVKHTLLKNLQEWATEAEVPVRKIGITHAVMIYADTNPPKFWYSQDSRQQSLLARRAIRRGRRPDGRGGRRSRRRSDADGCRRPEESKAGPPLPGENLPKGINKSAAPGLPGAVRLAARGQG